MSDHTGLRVISQADGYDSELDCFLKLLDYYTDKIIAHENQEIPISILLIKLMELLKRTQNKILITKALIITISFFEHIPTDMYNNQGIDIDFLPLKYKERALSLLRQEFLLN